MKFTSVLNLIPHKTAYAHCDIPCGIYDPHSAQLAAHTIIRMTQLLKDEKDLHNISRLAHVKEEHGELVEEELGTLENDYFKEEHFKKFANLRNLIEKGVKLSITARQNIDMKSSHELLETVMQVAEIFYKTKNVSSKRVKSTYPTELEIVVQA